jgi:hypothetical protein
VTPVQVPTTEVYIYGPTNGGRGEVPPAAEIKPAVAQRRRLLSFLVTRDCLGSHVVLVTRTDHLGTHVPWLPNARGASGPRALPQALNDSGYVPSQQTDSIMQPQKCN